MHLAIGLSILAWGAFCARVTYKRNKTLHAFRNLNKEACLLIHNFGGISAWQKQILCGGHGAYLSGFLLCVGAACTTLAIF